MKMVFQQGKDQLPVVVLGVDLSMCNQRGVEYEAGKGKHLPNPHWIGPIYAGLNGDGHRREALLQVGSCLRKTACL